MPLSDFASDRRDSELAADERLPIRERVAVRVAFISNQLTPYRQHVLERIAAECPYVELHSLFTHGLQKANVPWRIDPPRAIRPVFQERYKLTRGRFFDRTSWSMYRFLTRYCDSHAIDLVVLMGYSDLTRMLFIRWASRRSICLLLNGDCNVFSEGRVRGIKRAIKRMWLRWVVRRVDGLMPMGTAGRAFVRVYVDHDKPTFLFPYEPDYQPYERRDEQAVRRFVREHGLESKQRGDAREPKAEGETDGEARTTPGATGGERKRLLYVGRLVAWKRVGDAIEAFARIARERPEWDLVVVGTGPEEAALRQQVDQAGADLTGRVRFLGFLQPDEVRLAMQASHVLVHPSDYEPWGVVINEAAAAGLAIVTTEVVGAAVELVRHQLTGWIVPPRQPDQLAAGLRRVTESDVAAHMGQQARARLQQWRQEADPIEGLRAAIEFFQNPGR